MTPDLATLQIRVLSDDVVKAEARLAKLERRGTSTEKATSKFASGAKKLVAFAAASVAVGAAIRGIKDVTRVTAEFQQLNAQLVTATGSATNAAAAFTAIKDFAVQTPYDLQQATGAFISLVNRGLTPSERALRSYGDTASSMGFQLQDMVLAVSNATAGEFETLKRFGIRAKKEGENINLTFRGVTTTVGNSIEEIENYFIELGETNFSGGMERQMQTLTGATSNFEDAWEIMLNAVGEAGLGEMVESGIRQATAAVEEFTAFIASGALGKEIDAWGEAFVGYGEDVAFVLDWLNTMLGEHGDNIEESNRSGWERVIDFLQQIPPAFRAVVQLIAVELWYNVEVAKAVGAALVDTFTASFAGILASAKAYGAGIASALNPLDGTSATQDLANATSAAGKAQEEAYAKVSKSLDQNIAKIQIARDVKVSEQKAAVAGFDATVAKSREARDESGKLLEAYKAEAEARAGAKGDRLEKFKVGGGGGASGATGGGKGGGGGSGPSEFERLVAELEREEEAIAASYERRQQLIDANLSTNSDARAELSLTLLDQLEEETQRVIDNKKRETETFFEALTAQERLIEDSYERRKEIILANTEATETEKLAMLEAAERAYTDRMRQHEAERNAAVADLAGDFFGNIAQIANAFGSKGAKVAKAAAIAQTTIKTYEAATSAYASLAGIPYIGPALGAAAAGAAIAAGLANVQAIKSQSDSLPMYDLGGMIPAGAQGIVGERGPEIVNGPAIVTSRNTTAGNGLAGAGGNVILNVFAPPGVEVEKQEQRDTPDGKVIELFLRQADERIARGIQTGTGQTARAIEGKYQLERTGK